jgi:hypothetical protein
MILVLLGSRARTRLAVLAAAVPAVLIELLELLRRTPAPMPTPTAAVPTANTTGSG